jgi:endogenous inhibitor of DNA gyrase (YacG/DUF329 family)
MTAAADGRERMCPICGKPPTKESFPFCSKRCADVDLNRWLKGAYVLSARGDSAEEETPEEAATEPAGRPSEE